LASHLRVIASPGGLDVERQTFREVVNKHNELDAIRRGVLFIPVGWDLTLAGMGRPQELINQYLTKCDYFVLILSDRWGSKPAKNGKYTSGTAEIVSFEQPEHKLFPASVAHASQVFDRQAKDASHPLLMEQLVHILIDCDLVLPQLAFGGFEIK
jgi:hypothetical protein